MAVTLTKVGKTPGQTQFGLDTFTEHWKTDTTADVVLTDPSVPQRGDVHPDYEFMFLTDRHCQETGEKASALDLVYTGCLKDDGDGNPILPPSRQKYGTAVQTASSQIPAVGAPATQPITLKFYASTSELTFMSYNAVGALNTAPDPVDDPVIISLTSYDFAYAPTVGLIDEIIARFFTLQETDTITPQEIVSGKFWQNTEIKTLYYGPPISVVVIFGGDKVVYVFATGKNYSVSDTLTLTGGGGSATLTVTSVGPRGAITGISVSADTITATNILIIDATGGSGTGARCACLDF
jgi:hypothetical protein